MKKNTFIPCLKGFTLVELLTVIGIFSIIGTIAVSVIVVTLRTTKKTDLIETARQNSDTALTLMVKNIRYAGSIDFPNACTGASQDHIIFTSVTDHLQTKYQCDVNPPGSGTIYANGTSLFDTKVLSISACSFSCSQPNPYDHPTVTIQYTLVPRITSGLTETNFTLPFENTITLRNVQ